MQGPPPLPKSRASVAVARPLPMPSPRALASSRGTPTGAQLEPEAFKVEAVRARESQVPGARGGMDWLSEAAPPSKVVQTSENVARKRTLATAATCAVGLLAALGLLFWQSPRLGPSHRPTSGTVEVLAMPASAAHASTADQAPGTASDHDATVRPAAPELGEAQAPQMARHDSEEHTERVRGHRKGSAPRRAEVLDALGRVAPHVAACIGPHGGGARVRLTFAGSTGQVVRAKVLEKSDRGVLGCITHAVSQAKVPAFGKPRFSVRHTFRR